METEDLANFRNFWLNKSREKNILKVVDWAHKNNKKVTCLEIHEILDALKSYIRTSLHS